MLALAAVAPAQVSLPALPYASDALEPVIGRQTVELHYGKHFAGYVNKVNELVAGTDYAGKSLEDIVRTAPDGALFNNAGQTLNHALYFGQFRAPRADNAPAGRLLKALEADFGSYDAFRAAFTKAALGIFGSGWVWLSVTDAGHLVISTEPNGGNPLRRGLRPLLGFDIWEHAYYLDYQNRRADHVAALWSLIDWDIVAARLGE